MNIDLSYVWHGKKKDSEAPALKRSRLDTIIQNALFVTKNNYDLVVSSTNYQKALDSVKKRALYGNSYFPEVSRRLQIVTEEELVANKQHDITYAINRQPMKS